MSTISTQNAWTASNNALAAALTTVSTSANMVTRTVGAADNGLDMLERYLTKAQYQQRLRHAKDKLAYRNKLAVEHSIETSELAHNVTRKLEGNPDLRERFNEAYAEINTLFDAVEG